MIPIIIDLITVFDRVGQSSIWKMYAFPLLNHLVFKERSMANIAHIFISHNNKYSGIFNKDL